jgi:hypothetical protein
MPDKSNKVPTLLIRRVTGSISKRGHSCEAHAVLNDVIQFTIGQLLSCGLGHIGRFRIQASPSPCGSAPIISMA